jgi:hypothetical protein
VQAVVLNVTVDSEPNVPNVCLGKCSSAIPVLTHAPPREEKIPPMAFAKLRCIPMTFLASRDSTIKNSKLGTSTRASLARLDASVR